MLYNKISIADSDINFKLLLINKLTSNPFNEIVKNCNNGHELINQLYYKIEDLFLIDLYMPILSGVETLKYIRKIGISTPILLYSSTFQLDTYNYLSEYNNTYYCQKNSQIIIDLVKNIISNNLDYYDSYLDEWKKNQLIVEEYLKNHQDKYIPNMIEIQIIKLCYQGFSNKEMGEKLNLSSRTIDTYTLNLLNKLKLKKKLDLIRYSVENGYYNFND
jgi:DNA-binding NarL/FixJ family response regulator